MVSILLWGVNFGISRYHYRQKGEVPFLAMNIETHHLFSHHLFSLFTLPLFSLPLFPLFPFPYLPFAPNPYFPVPALEDFLPPAGNDHNIIVRIFTYRSEGRKNLLRRALPGAIRFCHQRSVMIKENDAFFRQAESAYHVLRI